MNRTKQILSIVGILSLTAAAAGCGASVGAGNGAGTGGGVNVNSQSLTYDDKENGCDTGEHTFSSTDDYCNGLQSEQLNKGCAQDLRKMDFQQYCAGKTWNPA